MTFQQDCFRNFGQKADHAGHISFITEDVSLESIEDAHGNVVFGQAVVGQQLSPIQTWTTEIRFAFSKPSQDV